MSSSALLSSGPLGARAASGINVPTSVTAAAGILGGVALIGSVVAPKQAALYVLGAALGLVLYHAAFGFTSAWRVFIADRRGEGLRAQMVMLAIASALFFPVLAAGSLFGQPVAGLVSPAGISVVFGAFIFGIGMQLGGGCASGTLYTVGGGSTRMLITLAAFIAGSAIGAYFSGIASGSLHGWVWLVAAFLGNVLGTKFRPLFGLEVERVKPTGC